MAAWNRAPARLIATIAPELFEALQEFDMPCYTDKELQLLTESTTCRGEINPRIAKKVIKLRVASAKARGTE